MYTYKTVKGRGREREREAERKESHNSWSPQMYTTILCHLFLWTQAEMYASIKYKYTSTPSHTRELLLLRKPKEGTIAVVNSTPLFKPCFIIIILYNKIISHTTLAVAKKKRPLRDSVSLKAEMGSRMRWRRGKNFHHRHTSKARHQTASHLISRRVSPSGSVRVMSWFV